MKKLLAIIGALVAGGLR